MSDTEKEFLEYLIVISKTNKINTFSLTIKSVNVYENIDEIIKINQNIDDDIFNYNNYKNMFFLCLYIYQIEHESKYLWKKKEKVFDEFENLENLVQNIFGYLSKENKLNLDFQVQVTHNYLEDFIGIMDCFDKNTNTVYEIKYTKNVTLIHKLQAFLYFNILNPSFKNTKNKIKLINLYTGKLYNIYLEENNLNAFNFIDYLAQILKSKIKNMYILYDLETTGLIENNKYPDIIDRHFYDININACLDEGLINPGHPLPKIITEITGLTDHDLEGQEEFSDFKIKFKNLYAKFDKPTFIAHNGSYFDHKIMKYYELFDDNCKLLDSRFIIMGMCQVKGKLTEMYEKICGEPCGKAHRAKEDVILVEKIFQKLDIINKLALK